MQINISKKAKEYRLDRGLSQSEVSEAVGLNLDEYVGLEEGSFNPNYYTVLDIARFYDVPVSYIYDRSKIIVKNMIEKFINKSTNTVETEDYVVYKYEKIVDENYTYS